MPDHTAMTTIRPNAAGSGLPLRQARQRGATLVELMVAIAIGLVVTLAVTTAYISGNRTQTVQSDLLRLQEAGRFALHLLANEVARAGYRNIFTGSNSNRAQEFGATGNKLHRLEGVDGDPPDLAANNFYGDSLTVRFYGDDNSAGTAADDNTLDCQGTMRRQNVMVTEALAITKDSKNVPWLSCAVSAIDSAGSAITTGACTASSSSSPPACGLVPGVEAMQFLYGVDNDQDGAVDYYVRAGAMDDAKWQRLVSVRVALVLRTESPTGNQSANETPQAQTFNMFGANYNNSSDSGRTYTLSGDGRLRRLFTTEVFLRNRESTS